MGQDGQEVRKRRVFYIPGYDPIHPRRYRELYRSEGAGQAAISGYALALQAKRAGGPYGWQVEATIDGARVETEIEVLVWSDIVRGSMDQSIPGTYLQLLRTAWTYLSTGALFRLMRLRKGPIIAALYPIAMLLAQLALAIALGAALAVALSRGAGALLAQVPGDAAAADWAAPRLLAATLIGALAGGATLRWFQRRDGRFFAYYLMHDYAFAARTGGANPPALEARMTEFRHRIRAALETSVDEVLVVGHSSGAHLAVSILADLVRDGLRARRPALALLSLGQVVPMVSFLPGATRLRRDLRDLSARDDLTWVDVTAPGDGCAFALCDPVAVSGVAPPGKRWPLVISAAFSQTLAPDRWKALRWRFFRLHFQYLCAFDRPGAYDYFRITAGPVTLATRFAGRAPSKSRIETPVNGHASIAA